MENRKMYLINLMQDKKIKTETNVNLSEREEIKWIKKIQLKLHFETLSDTDVEQKQSKTNNPTFKVGQH